MARILTRALLYNKEGPPEKYGETPPEKRARVAANVAADTARTAVRGAIARLATNDPTIGVARFAILAAMSVATIGGTIGVIWISLTTKELAGIIVSGSAVLFGLLYAGLVNPLQTVERDMVFRRWSDMIVNIYLDELADEKDADAAGTSANSRFTALATSYSALSSKSADVLVELAKTSAAESKKSEPTQISVDNPGPQKFTADTELDPAFAISATGPGTLKYDAPDLPGTLKLDEKTGEFTGKTPAEDKDYEVTVTVTSDAEQTGSAAVTFTITVEPKK